MKATKQDCVGCRDDFYNGKNEYGVQECWNFKTAEIVTLYQIGYWTPMDRAENFIKVKRPRCYHAEGFAYLKELPEHLRRTGYQPALGEQEDE